MVDNKMLEVFDGVVPFVYVARERSFKRAAASLGVTSAALSKAVKRLEERLGVVLLVRTTRQVSLSPEGELFLARCEEALSLVREGQAAAMLSQSLAQGELVISISGVLAAHVMGRLGVLLTLYPGIRPSVRITDVQANLLGDGVDVALRIGALEDSALIARRLYEPRWVVVGSPSYLARFKAPAHPRELEGHRCLKFRGPSGALVEWSFGPKVRVKTPCALEVDDGQALVRAAAAGLGLVQAFDFMVSEQLSQGSLIEVLADWSVPGPAVHALCLPGQQHVPRVRAFLEFAQELFRA